MTPDLPDELEMFRRVVRRFVDTEMIPLEALPQPLGPEIVADLREKAKRVGLRLLDVPEALGGQGLGTLGMSVFWEEISRTVAISARDSSVFAALTGPILLSLEGEMRDRYLLPVLAGDKTTCFAQTEPDAGSDPGSMRTRAIRDGDDYVITGVKRFITDAETADFAQLIASTDPARGSHGLSCFLVDMHLPGVRVTAQYDTITSDRPCEIVLDGVRVPAVNRVGKEGDGFALAQQWITEGRILRHGARSCGVAERCLELSTSYATQRKTFGVPLADRQAVQFMIADTYAELQATRALVRRAAAAHEAGGDVRLQSWIAKCQGTEMGFRAADRCMQIHGGMGLTKDLPIERMWREQRSFIITEGAAEVMRAAIARKVIDQYAK
ncbi:acyl-CoA dehydrogenase family protein [Bradyrhizobium sp. USDA 4469]